MHPPLTHVAGIRMRPALAFASSWNEMQAASAVRVNLQALLEEFGKWLALRTICSKPFCLQHMLTNSPAFSIGLELLTISCMPTCMTVTPFHHGFWLRLWHVDRVKAGTRAGLQERETIFSAVYSEVRAVSALIHACPLLALVSLVVC